MALETVRKAMTKTVARSATRTNSSVATESALRKTSYATAKPIARTDRMKRTASAMAETKHPNVKNTRVPTAFVYSFRTCATISRTVTTVVMKKENAVCI